MLLSPADQGSLARATLACRRNADQAQSRRDRLQSKIQGPSRWATLVGLIERGFLRAAHARDQLHSRPTPQLAAHDVGQGYREFL